MTQLEQLIDDATNHGIIVDERMLAEGSKLDGLYLHWEHIALTVILLNRHRTQSVQYAVMSEEIGHYFTCVGNAIGDDVACAKLEKAGRTDAYKRVLPARKLSAALRSGSCSLWELSQCFGLPEQFVKDAFQYYTQAGCLRLGDADCHWCYAI